MERKEMKETSDAKAELKAETKPAKANPISPWIYALIVVSIGLAIFNQYQIYSLTGAVISSANSVTGSVTSSSAGSGSISAPSVIPTGVPAIYGQELGISYDDVSPNNPTKADATIRTLAMLDVNINLTGADLQRYINIAGKISCEYCCGAESIIFSNGQAACGCAHSYAMRGVAKYLITEHPTEFTDDQILEELGKWKTLFFPGAITQKAAILQSQGIELNYINLASNKYRGIEQGATGGSMVGGC